MAPVEETVEETFAKQGAVAVLEYLLETLPTATKLKRNVTRAPLKLVEMSVAKRLGPTSGALLRRVFTRVKRATESGKVVSSHLSPSAVSQRARHRSRQKAIGVSACFWTIMKKGWQGKEYCECPYIKERFLVVRYSIRREVSRVKDREAIPPLGHCYSEP